MEKNCRHPPLRDKTGALQRDCLVESWILLVSICISSSLLMPVAAAAVEAAFAAAAYADSKLIFVGPGGAGGGRSLGPPTIPPTPLPFFYLVDCASTTVLAGTNHHQY